MNPPNELSNEKTETNKVESKDIFKNLKSKYILQKVFYNLLRKKSLDIIKYNNNIKERINKSIKDYKEYSEIYSSIEIEIKPVKNGYGKFINMKENEKYFHIYFNDNKEEIKKTELNKEDKVSKIYIIIDYQIESFYGLFNFCNCIESINFKKFYRNNITNMSYMFFECTMLTKIELSKFKVNNINNMSNMFSGCESLKEINISNFKINNKTNLNFMFCGCSSLNSLKFCNFNNYNLDGIEFMFFGCSKDFINSIKK